MEKLIELLNKAHNSGAELFGHRIGSFGRTYYSKNHWKLIIDTLGYTDENYETYFYSDRDICGKDGGFIKWLVDNDKIDREGGICPREELVKEVIIEDRETHKPIGYKNKYTEYEQLLMYLAIQDEPIEFLISILK